MRVELTSIEDRMRKALMRELRRQHGPVAPDRQDIIKKTWLVVKGDHRATLLEGRLARNVWSGDIEISFRRFSVPWEDK
jgi:hypothetical protein